MTAPQPALGRALEWHRRAAADFLLRRILAGRGVPEGAPAPCEMRPSRNPPEQAPALARLAARVEEAERALRDAAPGTRLPHAYFGLLRPDQMLGVQAAHLDHHRRQLSSAL